MMLLLNGNIHKFVVDNRMYCKIKNICNGLRKVLNVPFGS